MAIRCTRLFVIVMFLAISLPVHSTFAQQPLTGDFNGDQVLDCRDIDILSIEIRAGTHTATYDLNDSGRVDLEDLGIWQGYAYEARGLGSNDDWILTDFNLDGVFNHADANVFGIHAASEDVTSWCQGDRDVDGDVDGNDL